MLDLNNREYKSVAFFEPGEWVCFEMENGLAYVVLLKKQEIDYRVYADSILRFVDDVIPGDKISKDELQRAVEILKTAPCPRLDGSGLKDLDEAVRYKLAEMHKQL